jgi:hypothetical protein
MNYLRSTVRIVFIVGLVGLMGCGSRTATVSGKITLPSGKPLPGGQITFQSISKPDIKATGEFSADGVYTLEHVPTGECIVLINNTHLKNAPPAPQIKPGAAMGGKVSEDSLVRYVAIDSKYTSSSTSDLKVTVRWSSSSVDFQVK